MPLGRYDDEDLPIVIPGPVPFQKTRALHQTAAGLPNIFDHMPGAPINAGREGMMGGAMPGMSGGMMGGMSGGVIDPTRSATTNLPRVPFEDTLMRGILSAPGPPPAMPEEEEMPLGF